MERLYETGVTDFVCESLRALPAVGGMAIITGSSGVGKTWALHVGQQHLPRLRMVNPTPSSPGGGTPRAFYRDIAAKLHIDVPHQAGAVDLVEAIRREVTERGVLLAIDHADDLALRQMTYLRHLVDELGYLAVVGGPGVRMKVCANPMLASRTRLPIEVEPLGLMDVQKLFGEEFGADCLREMHGRTAGLWGPLTTLMVASRQIALSRRTETQALTADDVTVIAEQFLLARAAA